MENKAPRPPKFLKLKDIKPGQHGYNVVVKVVESTITTVNRADGSSLSIAEGKVADDTANIKFRVAGVYAPLLVKDAVVSFRNGRSDVFKEKHRLEIDRWGKIIEEKEPIEKIDDKNDMSKTSYETKVVRK